MGARLGQWANSMRTSAAQSVGGQYIQKCPRLGCSLAVDIRKCLQGVYVSRTAQRISGRSAGKSRFQPATQTYTRISTAPPAPSCRYTRIKGRPLIKQLIDTNHRAIKALKHIKKSPPCLNLNCGSNGSKSTIISTV